VLIDGAQAVAHIDLDLKALDADFYVFSGHKLYGPTGIGVLYGKLDRLKELPPYQGGGDMIKEVRFEGTTYAEPPFKFEAGTPNIAGAIGLAAAIEYLEGVGIENAVAHEESLMHYLLDAVAEMTHVQRVGSPKRSVGIFSFLVPGTHPSDIGMLLDQQGVAIRTGHHCTQPLMQYLNAPGTARASLSFYNTKNDVDAFVQALDKACRLLV
jgi:cysteine desulfurase/selenocysteine lyase